MTCLSELSVACAMVFFVLSLLEQKSASAQLIAKDIFQVVLLDTEQKQLHQLYFHV